MSPLVPAVLCGAGVGLGVLALAVWVHPARTPLARLLTHLQQTPPPPPLITGEHDGDTGWAQALGRPFIPALTRLGLPSLGVAEDLQILGRSTEAHLAQKAALALLGLLTPPAGLLLLTLLGAHPPLVISTLFALGVAAVGFLLPDLQVRAAAKRRRTDFRHALSAYLDLVVVSLSGGAGIEGALADAGSVGQGWAFAQLRQAIEAAQLTRTTPWATLQRLGQDLDSHELRELAASLSLAGTEGARVRTSLTTRAASMRTHLLTDADAQARAATERMGLPWGLLFLGFVIFIGYPAMHQILTGL